MRPVFTLAALLATVGCAPKPPSDLSQKQETLGIYSGDETHLAALETAAERCGLKGVERLHPYKGVVWVRLSGPSSDETPGYDCTLAWLVPRIGDYSMIGNAAD